MYQLSEITHIHLEISSKCNASCPLCPRNFYGYAYNDGYVERDLTLTEVKQIFSVDFLKQLKKIYINGNFGDIVMNNEAIDIIKYFRESNKNLIITISTNGGARDKKFWIDLANLGAIVSFCIDGLNDTHSLYRKNTAYATVIKNATTFIDAGGTAIWKMIKFDHNQHQHSWARDLSVDLGFKKFNLVDHGRHTGPVFNDRQELLHVIGNPAVVEFKQLYKNRVSSEVLLEDITSNRSPKEISCQVKKQKSIYVASTGEVYPCCFLGFSPKTYGHGNYHQAANAQFKDFIVKNNALEYPLEECIKWFEEVEKTWQIPTFEQGRLVVCNDVCGSKNN